MLPLPFHSLVVPPIRILTARNNESNGIVATLRLPGNGHNAMLAFHTFLRSIQ
jgi:hypothetical protein